MSKLGQVVEAVEKHGQFVLEQVKGAIILFVMLSEVETSLTFSDYSTGSSTSLRFAQNDRVEGAATD